MTDKEQKKAAKAFAEYWKDKGDEKSDTQSFWLMLLREVYGVEEPEKYAQFEKRVKNDNMNFIDCYIKSTRVIIEQKSLNKALDKPIKQSNGEALTPFEQAKKYITNLPVDEHPYWIIACNFKEFEIHNMKTPHAEPQIVLLKDLPKQFHQLDFLVKEKSDFIKKEEQVSLAAGELVGKLYDALIKQYKDPTSEHALKSLNITGI